MWGDRERDGGGLTHGHVMVLLATMANAMTYDLKSSRLQYAVEIYGKAGIGKSELSAVLMSLGFGVMKPDPHLMREATGKKGNQHAMGKLLLRQDAQHRCFLIANEQWEVEDRKVYNQMVDGDDVECSLMHTQKTLRRKFDKLIMTMKNDDEFPQKPMTDYRWRRDVVINLYTLNTPTADEHAPLEMLPQIRIHTTGEVGYIIALMSSAHQLRQKITMNNIWAYIGRYCPSMTIKEKKITMLNTCKQSEGLVDFFDNGTVFFGDDLSCTRRELCGKIARHMKKFGCEELEQGLVKNLMDPGRMRFLLDVRGVIFFRIQKCRF
tara:strand:- start:327 stop:1292 length:966 start_codon:yes stop_codon:yes gene_type:complete